VLTPFTTISRARVCVQWGGGFNGDAFHFVCVGCDIGVEEDTFEGKPLAERSFPIAKDAIVWYKGHGLGFFCGTLIVCAKLVGLMATKPVCMATNCVEYLLNRFVGNRCG
jgi:hypothetical protein